MQAITVVVFERYRLLDLSDARFQLSASVIEIKHWVLITELVKLAEHAQVLLAAEFSAISISFSEGGNRLQNFVKCCSDFSELLSISEILIRVMLYCKCII